METFRLDPQQVEATFGECLIEDGPGEDAVEVDCIVFPAKLSKKKLADHSELILAMLLELPEQFRQSGGGGWSFLNACNDRHGNQWTGLHRTMAMLFGLGLGLGLVGCLMPREMWEVLPGGMPYYIVKDGPRSGQEGVSSDGVV